MKKIYFVRHGQTFKNTRHIHQGPEEPLTEKGRAQAAQVALKLKAFGIDALVTSPFTRAMETAEIIGRELGLPFVLAESVKEFRRPTHLYGASHYSVGSLGYLWRLFLHRNDPTWDDDGAENMFAIRNRILDAKRSLYEVPGERIAVVSHAIFIDMFAQAVCADRDLHMREFLSGLLGAKKLPNTGIVAFALDETAPPDTCNWWLLKDETDPQYVRYQ